MSVRVLMLMAGVVILYLRIASNSNFFYSNKHDLWSFLGCYQYLFWRKFNCCNLLIIKILVNLINKNRAFFDVENMRKMSVF